MPRGRILIADNYRTGREALADLLREEGYAVETMPQTSFVTERIVEFAPDLLVLGMGRSFRASLNLIAHVRQSSPRTIVISVSSSKDISLARATLEAGAAAYLPKPLHFASLLAALRPLLITWTERGANPSNNEQ